MPKFNPQLSFTRKEREKRIKNSINTNNTYTVIKKTVIGVICIDIEGSYFVITDNGNYKLTDDSYIIKPNKGFYPQQIIDGKRLRITEITDEKKRYNEKLFLPFAPGVCCIGSIVKNNITKTTLYRLKKTFIDNGNKIARDAWNYYVNNYNEIVKNLNK